MWMIEQRLTKSLPVGEVGRVKVDGFLQVGKGLRCFGFPRVKLRRQPGKSGLPWPGRHGPIGFHTRTGEIGRFQERFAEAQSFRRGVVDHDFIVRRLRCPRSLYQTGIPRSSWAATGAEDSKRRI
jgi:hypothetical protein